MIDLAGTDKINATLRALLRSFTNQLGRALQSELEIESTESQRRTPVETGALRASHRVEVTISNGEITGTITVGGPSAEYAVFVHENLEAFHPVGEAKFLENTVTEAASFLGKRIAARLDLGR